MNSLFFNANSYFIDQKVHLFQFENSYQIYNDRSENIGSVVQSLSTGQKILRLLVKKPLLPFRLAIKDAKRQVQASVVRGWTLFMSKIKIEDGAGQPLGSIKQRFRLFKPTFEIYSRSDRLLATITGDWQAWNFEIKDAQEKIIGSITKKWSGALKELFTNADKYQVQLESAYSNQENKIVILAGAITLDMVLKESTN